MLFDRDETMKHETIFKTVNTDKWEEVLSYGGERLSHTRIYWQLPDITPSKQIVGFLVVLRMSNNRTTKKVILGHWTNERTQQGRLNGGVVNYWRRLIREAGEDWTNIENLTQDRKKWKATVKRRKEALEKWESEMCRYRGGENTTG